MQVDSVRIFAILSMLYITTRIVKNIDKCSKNSQFARRKSNYHTKCGKNCHKILSVYLNIGTSALKFLQIYRGHEFSEFFHFVNHIFIFSCLQPSDTVVEIGIVDDPENTVLTKYRSDVIQDDEICRIEVSTDAAPMLGSTESSKYTIAPLYMYTIFSQAVFIPSTTFHESHDATFVPPHRVR